MDIKIYYITHNDSLPIQLLYYNDGTRVLLYRIYSRHPERAINIILYKRKSLCMYVCICKYTCASI